MSLHNPLTPAAERALVSIAARLAMTGTADNLSAWVKCLADVLPDCEDCVAPLEPVRLAALDLVAAGDADARRTALARLEIEAQRYYDLAAAKKFEAWQQLDKDRVVD